MSNAFDKRQKYLQCLYLHFRFVIVFNAKRAALACCSLCVLVALSSIDYVRLFHRSVMTCQCPRVSCQQNECVFFPFRKQNLLHHLVCDHSGCVSEDSACAAYSESDHYT